MKINCKTTLLPAPFSGTRIRIALDDPESLTWGISKLTLAEGHEKAVIDWGDGSQNQTDGSGNLTHTYAQPGEYEVRFSDDIASLSCSTLGTSSVFHSIYAPMIREFRTTAALLESIAFYGFFGATNLTAFHCERSGLRKIGAYALAKCSRLVGRVDLPGITDIVATVFSLSDKVTELHFSAANESIVKSLPAWESSGGKFGAVNATTFFDL